VKNPSNFLENNNIDALLVSHHADIRYMTGFTTLAPHEREAYALVTKQSIYFFSDARYQEEFKVQKPSFCLSMTGLGMEKPTFILLTPDKGLVKHLQQIIVDEQIKQLGFQSEDLRWAEYTSLSKLLPTKLIATNRVLSRIRAIKQAYEVDCIKKACEISDLCLAELSKLIRPSLTEKELAWKIEKWIRYKGYELSFDPIVAVDTQSALPHYNTRRGNGKIKESSILLIDMGVRYRDYNSDMTRMFFVGKQTDEVINSYTILHKVQSKTIRFIREGMECVEADSFCRSQLTDQGLDHYPHSTGHGIGLDVHEYPKISAVSKDVFRRHNVFSIEPALYMMDKWGMRIEDTVCINVKGKVEVLTKFNKELTLLH